MFFGIIYKATNKINGKSYVGQTIQGMKIRKHQHKCDSDDTYFHRAIKKYKIDNFSWKILEHCGSREELNEMEVHYIKQYNALKPGGYNLTCGGDSGFECSEETRLKISNALKGKPLSDETKRKLSIALSGKNNPMYGFRGLEHPAYGNVLSKETKEKMSKAKIGKKRTLISRERQSKNHARISGEAHWGFGQERRDETKKKISNSLMGRYRGKESPNSKKYVITTSDDDEFMIACLTTFCEKYKLNIAHLSSCATGKRSHHKGFKCRHYDENKDINIMEE